MGKKSSCDMYKDQELTFFQEKYRKLVIFAVLYFILLLFTSSLNACSKGKVICNWIDRVTVVKVGDMTASAVALGNDFFVTNKHVVEENLSVQIMDSEGSFVKAYVLPNGHASDLVLLSLNDNSETLVNQIVVPKKLDNLRGVAYGIGRGKIRIFPIGNLISRPPRNLKQARIHSTIRNLPGISGGALINSRGELVGILASGSGLYNEAIPVHILNEVISESLISKKEFLDRGQAFKLCAQLISEASKFTLKLSKQFLSKLKSSCEKANNKTLFDMAGQVLGTIGLFDESIVYLNKSAKLDPNSPTTLLSLAIALQFKRSYLQQIKVLDHLLTFLQDNPLVLRMAVQAAAFSKDRNFAEKSLMLLKEYNRNAYPQALEFLKNHFESI